MSRILDFLTGKSNSKQPVSSGVSVSNSSGSQMELPNTSNYPIAPNWFFSATLGQPRNINFYELRQFARSPWVQVCINAILKQVFTTKWNLTTVKEDDEQTYDELKIKIERFLKKPNPFGGTFKSVFYPYLKDILLLDQAVIYKARNSKGEVEALMPYDGVKFLVDMDGHGIVRGYYEYSYMFVRAQPKFYPKEDIIMIPFNYSSEFHPYGWSPLQSIVQIVELLINATKFNKEFFLNSAIPSAIIDVLSNDLDNLQRFQKQWESEFKGKPHKLMISNIPTALKQLNVSNREMEWLEGQKWYQHSIFASYGLSPQEAGYYEDSNRSTSETQERVSSRNGIQPYYNYLADIINYEIIQDKWGEECPLKFEWIITDGVKEQSEHQQLMDKIDRKIYTINEVRIMEGLKPIEGGDSIQPQNNNFNNGVNENEKETNNFNENKNNDNKDKEDDKKETEKHIKETETVNKEVSSNNGEDVDEIFEDYSDYINKNFRKWEKEILKVIDSEYSEHKQKSLSVLVAKVMNFVSSSSFLTGLRKYIIKAFDNGVEEAETTLSFNFIPSDEMKSLIDIEFNKQLNGYNINGVQWDGLKGVSREIQNKVLQIVENGLNARKSINDVKNEIKLVFDKECGDEDSEGRSMKIARTETVRLKELGKHTALENSGLNIQKKWVAVMDSRTSERCKRLNGTIVDLREKFIDEGEEFLTPPSHPNCRCSTKAILKDK